MPQDLDNKPSDLLHSLSTQFSWRKIFFISLALFISFGILVIYENYTGHFKLAKIEKSMIVFDKLIDASKRTSSIDDDSINRIGKNISIELDSFISKTLTPFNLPMWLLKSYAAFAPWMLSVLIVMPSKSESTENSISNMVLAAIPFTIIGALLPTFQYTIINYLAYPVCSFALSTYIVGIIGKRRSKKL